MKKTNKKLSEDVIQDQNSVQTPAVPASNQEVQNATEANMTNNMMADGTIAAEDPNAVDETPVAEEPTQPETFTPPMAGMIPAGWVNPKDLGQAIAMETGDVQPAETAQDVQTAEQEDSMSATPADMNTEEPLVNPQVMESMKITKDELDMILEYRKYLADKMKESKTARVGDRIKIIEMDDNRRYNGKVGIVKKVESGCIYGTWGKSPLLENVDSYKILNKKSMSHSLEVAEEDEKEDISAGAPNVTKIEPAPLTESEDIPETGVNPIPAPEAEQKPETEELDIPAVEGSPEKENLEDEVPESEDLEDGLEDEDLEDDFEDDELLDRIDSFLANDTDDEIARTAFENTADLLDNIFDSDEEDDFEEDSDEDQIDVEDLDFVNNEDDLEDDDFDSDDFEDDDLEDDFEDEDIEDDTDILESRSRHRGKRMNEEIIYPAGSNPRRESFEREDNLVEAYKRQSYNKRKALEEYRKSLRESSYDKALRGTSRLDENEDYDEKSWRANKLRESEKLNYKELLNNGFLG